MFPVYNIDTTCGLEARLPSSKLGRAAHSDLDGIEIWTSTRAPLNVSSVSRSASPTSATRLGGGADLHSSPTFNRPTSMRDVHRERRDLVGDGTM